MANKTLSVKLSLNDKQFQSNLKKTTKSLKKFGTSLKNIGKNLSTNLTLPILAIGVASIKLASDFEESLNKVRVAFGSTSGEVEAFAKTTLESFGIAEGSALEMASLFGDMSTSMGLTEQEASSMSTSLVGLAGDLSSFKNIGIEQAQTALAGIFTGETESLKKLGIVMTEANLKSFALTQGMNSNVKSMTQAEKVALRYSFILANTSNAQGDFSRTSEGFANQTRKLQESLKQLGQELGKVLLPLATKIVVKFNALVKSFSNLTTEQKETILKVAGLVAVLGPLLIIVGSIAGAISTLIPIVVGLVAAFNPLVAVGLGVAAGLTFLGKKLGFFGDETKEVSEDIEEVVGQFDKLEKAIPTKTISAPKRQTLAPIESIKAESIDIDFNKIASGFKMATVEAQGLVETISPMQEMGNTIEGAFTQFGSSFEMTMTNAMMSSENFLTSFIDGIKVAIKQLLVQLAVTAFINTLMGGTGAGKLLGIGGGQGGIFGDGLKSVLGLQTGGLVQGPTLAMVGEGPGTSMSNPEVVAPLNQLESMMGGAGGSVEVFGRISGSDILISSDRARSNRNRTRGY